MTAVSPGVDHGTDAEEAVVVLRIALGDWVPVCNLDALDGG